MDGGCQALRVPALHQNRGLLVHDNLGYATSARGNHRGARDHHPYCFSYLLAGGGVPGGAVIGASDRTGNRPANRPVSPPEFAATLYRLLGLDTTDARVRPFIRDALPVAELAG